MGAPRSKGVQESRPFVVVGECTFQQGTGRRRHYGYFQGGLRNDEIQAKVEIVGYFFYYGLAGVLVGNLSVIGFLYHDIYCPLMRP